MRLSRETGMERRERGNKGERVSETARGERGGEKGRGDWHGTGLAV